MVDSISNDWYLYRKRRGHTHTHTHTKAESRDWSNAATSQGRPGATRKVKGRFFPTAFRGPSLPILSFQTLASRTETMNFCCFKSPNLWFFVMATLGSQNSQYSWTFSYKHIFFCLFFFFKFVSFTKLWSPWEQNCVTLVLYLIQNSTNIY